MSNEKNSHIPYAPTGEVVTDYVMMSTNGQFPLDANDQAAVLTGLSTVLIPFAVQVVSEGHVIDDSRAERVANTLGAPFFGNTSKDKYSAALYNMVNGKSNKPVVKAGMPLE